MIKQRGQALIESILMLFILIPFLVLIFSMSYLIYAREISSYFLYRALLCTEEFEKSASSCSRKTNTKLREVLFFHKRINTKITNVGDKRKIQTLGKFLIFNTIYKKELRVVIQ